MGVTSQQAVATTGITNQVTRSWDYWPSVGSSNKFDVCSINPSVGYYNWPTFDQFFSNNTTKDLIIVLGQPADYLVTRAIKGGSSVVGSKANMCPDNLVGWAAAVTAIVNRAKTTFGRTGLTWELWNEFDLTSFYNDPISLMGPYAKVTAQAIKAVDPTAKTSISISGAGNSVYLSAFLNASDGAGGTGKNWVDSISYHSYLGLNSRPTQFADDWNAIKAMQATLGTNFPVFIGEQGFAVSDTQQAIDHVRGLLTHIALGATCVVAYSFDDPSSFAMASAAAKWNAAAALIPAGAVISELTLSGNAIRLVINGVEVIY